ncbi:exodeoxyribonuclease III [Lapidilactobacillus luobeiensis]|uniref:exodeoxyribonuclease III n=1 Tax=Lapidilactobacillus luobeiensis TaxID=2950371 RepID=UPI0021C2A834|nr:exodeoxyribonuclease III [Lapidilactobacillus luobeiensis]
MKFISWNVNGLRAVLKKDFLTTFKELDADFFCLQETKMQAGQVDLALPGYQQYFDYAQRKGYSGTAIFTKHQPLSVQYGLGLTEHDQEGRAITLEYPNFYLVTCYTPNSQAELKRLDYRLSWDRAFRQYVSDLATKKSVIFCGDLNVAHQEIDLKNPKTNHHNAGFSDEERQSFSTLLAAGFTDTFRHFYPEQTGIYSWWSYRFHARDNNAGWRIDYFVTSQDLIPHLQDARILTDVYGSDHCPVELVTDDLGIEGTK